MLASAMEMLMALAGMSASDEAATGADHAGDVEDGARRVLGCCGCEEGDTDDEADGDGEVAVIVMGVMVPEGDGLLWLRRWCW